MTDKPMWSGKTTERVLPRIEVDQSEGSSFQNIVRHGTFAANEWALGRDGPANHSGLTPAAFVSNCVSEALLHLLELGFIDIDDERMQELRLVPPSRNDWR